MTIYVKDFINKTYVNMVKEHLDNIYVRKILIFLINMNV